MDTGLLIAIIGVFAVVAVNQLAPKVGVAAPLLLVVLGIGISFLPFVAPIEVEPEWILGGILPPLLYSTAVSTPAMEFRRDVGLISVYSVILVVVSAFAVGIILTWLIPGLSLALGVAVGAIVSPTDAVATSIVRRAGVSPRIVTILEGESLLNDASALVLLRTAIAASAAAVSVWEAGAAFVYAVVAAVVIGWLIGKVNLLLRSRITHPASSVAISLVVPFLAYLPAEHLGASGLVAAVAAGLVTGHGAPQRLSAEARLTETAVWRTIELLLESAVFLLMGLELFALVEDVHADHGSIGTAIALGAVAATVIVAIRTGVVSWSVWALSRRLKRQEGVRSRLDDLQERLTSTGPHIAGNSRIQLMVDRRYADLDYLAAERLGWREGTILVAAGMRGAVTLAAAQSLPAGTPHRSLLILISFVVAAGTLILQGGTLNVIAARLGMTGRDTAADAALRTALTADINAQVAARWEATPPTKLDGTPFSQHSIDAVRARLATPPPDSAEPSEFTDLRAWLLAAQREELLKLRAVGSYPSAALDAELRRIDADELSLSLRA